MADTADWDFVPTKKIRMRIVKPKGPRGPGRTAKSRVHKTRMMDIFRSPPEDFDGTNKKLGEYLGLSPRQISRLMKQLEAEGRVKLIYTINRLAAGGVYTTRMIQIPKEND